MHFLNGGVKTAGGPTSPSRGPGNIGSKAETIYRAPGPTDQGGKGLAVYRSNGPALENHAGGRHH